MIAAFAGGCCLRAGHAVEPRAREVSARPLTEPTLLEPTLLEPPPALQLVRSERLATIAPLVSRPPIDARAYDVDGYAAAGPIYADDGDEEAASTEEAAATAEDEDEDEDDAIRHVVVRTTRWGTPEELTRAAIRNVEAQRPRWLHAARMLLRFSGPICDCEGNPQERAEVRRHVAEVMRRSRPALKVCLTAQMAQDPRVIIKAPTLLVVSQAILREPAVYRFTPTVLVGPDGIEVEGVEWRAGDVSEALTSCLEGALQDAAHATSSLMETHRVQLPLVAFSQRPTGINVGSWHQALSLHAARFGWLFYERGELHEALELFRDAYWVFHLEEYQYLIGMTLEALGDPLAAADAYAAYLEARPYAPEAGTLQPHIEQLRELHS